MDLKLPTEDGIIYSVVTYLGYTSLPKRIRYAPEMSGVLKRAIQRDYVEDRFSI